MELRPLQHFGVVAIEKGAFGSPSTKVANFTYFTYCLLLEIEISCIFLALDRNTWICVITNKLCY